MFCPLVTNNGTVLSENYVLKIESNHQEAEVLAKHIVCLLNLQLFVKHNTIKKYNITQQYANSCNYCHYYKVFGIVPVQHFIIEQSSIE